MNELKKIIISLTVLLLFSFTGYSQENNIQLGSGLNQQRTSLAGFFDYSDPSGLNIKVNIWGFVKYPGKYIIPAGSTINDLLSYAGGPTDEARLDELRLVRTNDNNLQTVMRVNYDDVMFNTDATRIGTSLQLKAGDVLLVSGKPRLYFTNYFSLTLSVVSVLISLSILILNITRH